MEVVEQHGQVVVEAPCGLEVQVQGSRRDALDGRLLAEAEAVLSVPEFHDELEVSLLQHLFDLKSEDAISFPISTQKGIFLRREKLTLAGFNLGAFPLRGFNQQNVET